jgi:hypothetical protein
VERWEEELTLVQHEMVWTHNFYRKRKEEWGERARKSEESGELGHFCYAREQEHMWDQFRTDAKQSFRMFSNLPEAG